MRRLVCATLLALAACSTGPEPEPPRLELPEPTAVSDEDLTQWWQRFQDPALTAIVERALAHNHDLEAAVARIDEAKAISRVVGDMLPVVNLTGGAERSRRSERAAIPIFPGIPIESTSLTAGIDVLWEVDLWGRVRKANRAQLARLQATQEALHGLRASLTAQVARTYVALVATDVKLALLQETLANRDTALQTQRRRLEGGTANEYEVAQASSERESVRAPIPALEADRGRLERALKLLAGDSPRAIARAAVERAAALPQPPPVPEGLPSNLLARRPDIREAEADLAATHWVVAQQRTRYFPTIRLTGSYGRESEELGDLLSAPAAVWSIGASLVQPLIGLHRIAADVEAAEARMRQSQAAYVTTVQNAFAEVHDALGFLGASHATASALDDRLRALRDASRLAQIRYDAGLATYLELLDAQRNLLLVERERIDTEAFRLNATIDVYRALGGGWDG